MKAHQSVVVHVFIFTMTITTSAIAQSNLAECLSNAKSHFVEDELARPRCEKKVKFERFWVKTGSNVIQISEKGISLNSTKTSNILDSLKQHFPKNRPAIKIEVDSTAPHDSVLEVLDALQAEGISKITINTIFDN